MEYSQLPVSGDEVKVGDSMQAADHVYLAWRTIEYVQEIEQTQTKRDKYRRYTLRFIDTDQRVIREMWPRERVNIRRTTT